ncbi:class E sortase [Nocardiopsis gilva YIM 90087]|uniref:Class E sortase n=1 Tax=Nocardiopsis gilva YIM 90087 TaxID=1235441 RepID=A0A223S143_9ACTN|nr:class E sortase [Nocardiopsis gilva YIM 90087]
MVGLVGELALTAGLVMLLLAAWELHGKQIEVDRGQEQLATGLDEQWSQTAGPDAEPLPGSAHSRMYIPSLDLDWVVVHGVTQEDIRHAPGHYPDSAEPGQVGNYAIAAHRSPGMFWDVDLLEEGDAIVLEDRENFHTYEVIGNEVVTPDRVDVVGPDPFDPGNDEPERALVTLTTCYPKLSNEKRLIVYAELSDTRPKDQGMPESIAHMAPDTENQEG